MTKTRSKVLLIDDDEMLRELIHEELKKRGYAVTVASSAELGLVQLKEEDDFAAVLTDINMGGMSGIDLCARVRELREDLPVIVMTAFGSVELAVAAIRAGAYDFVTKPFDFDVLSLVLERAKKVHSLHGEVKRLRDEIAGRDDVSSTILGDSAPMRRLFDLLERVADTESTILVSGESGTGKELVARAVHDRSSRKGGPFVAINCAAMPESLLESELFGHSKGAFTDARAARPGLFVRANGGTLFLDEIGEMPLGMQAKLLRALQERCVRPVGSDAEVPFDARLVTATHRDLEQAVEEKRFREDLFYRVNVVRLQVPPLRARGNDILDLARHFVQRYAAESRRSITGISVAVAERLLAYPWPGNVRELQNSIERAVALARNEQIALEDLPDKIREYKAKRVDVDMAPATDDPTALPSMEIVERRYIRQVLAAVSGNKTLAAQILGFDRRTLYRKVERMMANGEAVA